MVSPIKDRVKEPKHHQTHSESPRLRAANNYYILYIMSLRLASCVVSWRLLPCVCPCPSQEKKKNPQNY